MDPPQEIVRTPLGRRLLERDQFAALWIHRTEDVTDRAVLAPYVQRLQAEPERAPCIGIEHLLQFSQPLLVVLDLLDRVLVALVMVLGPRVDVLKLDGGARRHPEALHVIHLAPPASA